jgi:hypothetical protein
MIYNHTQGESKDVLQIESYSLCGVYLLFSIACWFWFHHHPEEKGLLIKEGLLEITRDFDQS